MFKYFIKISVRSILKNKVNTALNVASLTIGITITLLIASFAINELDTDKFHSKNERIYKLSYGNSSLTPGPLNGFLKSQFPEIEQTTHLETRQLNLFSPVVQYKNNSYEIDQYYSADPGFFEIFDFEVVQGDIRSAIESPFSMILTESEASRIFNLTNPIGESVSWKGMKDFTFTVKAIVKDLPSNSSIQFDGLVSDASIIGMGGSRYAENWGHTVYESYLLLKPNVVVADFEEKLQENLIAHYASELSDKASANDAELNPLSLHKLTEVYFDKNLTNDSTNRGNLMLVNILLLIGGIILLLSVINYINLTTAQAGSRSKEIGVQKLIGSNQRNLVFQYLSETTVISFFAVVIATVFTLLLIEEFGQFMNVNGGLKFHPKMFLILIPTTLIIGFVAGIYPALHLASKKALEIIKMKTGKNNSGGNLRRSLIIFQFSATIVLIAATFLIFKQINYIKDKELGIPDDQIVYAKLPFPILAGKKDIFRERLQTIPEIEEVAFSSNIFGDIEGLNSQEIDGKTLNFATTWVDAEFIKLYNFELTEGRFFQKELQTDVNATALLNEAAVREFQVEDPFKLNIRIPGGNAKVVGIVKDFNYKSLHNAIEPLAIIYLPRQGQFVNLKIAGGNLTETLDKISTIWNELAPGFPFGYNFLDQNFEKLYTKDVQMAKAVSLFSLIAIAIAVLGILGLSIFLADTRTKEIGIRKVNGAKISEILSMLNKDFIKWVAIAFVIACPIAWYAVSKWLENFAYKTTLSWWIFALAGVLALGIALLTVSWQSWRAATRNPVEALRYE
ncbi:FtsX-like permease family protein [uncultured Draconibacterium sp.]|uniref:ABC transporter permease n=1 Tax=uncultured Draconibacterium sp. TaxID=1573823 RepID=UPI0029C6BC61|nr:FtsX-like permease family protein [uncultured Draconibacterium sp.]